MISFLNAFVLGALVLAAIPVLIHLLNRKKARVVYFSSLSFLKSLQNKRIRRVKLQQWLLLALRTLIVLVLVLAFARPVSRAFHGGSITSHGKTSVVMIVDTGIMSNYQSTRGQTLELAKRAAQKILGHLEEGDEVLLLTTTKPDIAGTFTKNFDEAGKWVHQLKTGYEKPSVLDAVYQGVMALEKAANPNKEIYVLSSMQDQAFSNDRVPIPANIHVVFIDLLASPVQNVAITKAAVASRLFEPGKPVELKMTLRKDGSGDADVQASVFVDQRRVAQVPVHLEGSGESESWVRFNLPKTGFSTGRIEIDDDALLEDNTRYFHVYAHDSIVVALVGDAPDTDLIALALNPDKGTPSRIKTRRLPASRAGTVDLAEINVLIMSNIAWSDAVHAKLNRALEDGKSVILFTGDRVDPMKYNRALDGWSAGSLLAPAVFDREVSFVEFSKIDMLHPMVAGLFEDAMGKRSLESPVFGKIMGHRSGRQTSAIITFTTGDGFLTETTAADARLLIFAVAPNLEWSDFPIRGLFAPLVNRAVFYLASVETSATGEKVSEAGHVVVVKSADREPPVLVAPDGQIIAPTARIAQSRRVMNLPRGMVPGTYEIKAGVERIGMVDVNLRPDDTHPAKVEKTRLEEIFDRTDLEILNENDSIESAILQSRYGTDLWGAFLVLALLLLLAETIIAQWDRIRTVFGRKAQPV